ncbi:hypothetical protein PanWU01x14_099020 [Parasponia andersonii]|uniref:Uncharacterized protein n=1 Tax=Parasponia andersonii TaxID=3476 RepID=A0A2P5D4D0_PARAD|nr:hypothetical protein PanWU01x14_099020 [Parasponia andersonii]
MENVSENFEREGKYRAFLQPWTSLKLLDFPYFLFRGAYLPRTNCNRVQRRLFLVITHFTFAPLDGLWRK